MSIKVIMIPHKHEYIRRLKIELMELGIETYLMPPFWRETLKNFIKICQLKLRGYEIIHFHWRSVFPNFLIMIIFIRFAKTIGYKIIWTMHNVLPHEYNSDTVKIAKWFYNHVDHRFIHYKSNIQQVKEKLNIIPSNYTIIHHPSFEGSYKNTINKGAARRKLGIPQDKKVILSFGLIKNYKGTDIFADAIERLDKEYYGIIAGKGIDKQVVEYIQSKKAKNLKIIAERIPDEDLQIYFNASDVVVQPYREITTSGVILLAYAFSKPVITTKLGGMPEVVIDGETGLLIPPNDINALTDSIKKIFSKDYTKMGENAFVWSREKFSWDSLAKKSSIVYNDIVKLGKIERRSK